MQRIDDLQKLGLNGIFHSIIPVNKVNYDFTTLVENDVIMYNNDYLYYVGSGYKILSDDPYLYLTDAELSREWVKR